MLREIQRKIFGGNHNAHTDPTTLPENTVEQTQSLYPKDLDPSMAEFFLNLTKLDRQLHALKPRQRYSSPQGQHLLNQITATQNEAAMKLAQLHPTLSNSDPNELTGSTPAPLTPDTLASLEADFVAQFACMGRGPCTTAATLRNLGHPLLLKLAETIDQKDEKGLYEDLEIFNTVPQQSQT